MADETLDFALTPPSCAVCGSNDARTLTHTVLASGAVVIVCGSHAVAHARAPLAASSTHELRAMFGERRGARDRRRPGRTDLDELASLLASAFIGERRGAGRRFADTIES
jgi:hypothetical protein